MALVSLIAILYIFAYWSYQCVLAMYDAFDVRLYIAERSIFGLIAIMIIYASYRLNTAVYNAINIKCESITQLYLTKYIAPPIAIFLMIFGIINILHIMYVDIDGDDISGDGMGRVILAYALVMIINRINYFTDLINKMVDTNNK